MSNINIHDALQILSTIKGLSDYQALTELEKLANLKSMQDVLDDIEDMNREYYLKRHPYQIYYSESDKRWRTYLPDSTKKNGRKPITSTKRENLENKIIKYYEDCAKAIAVPADTIVLLYPAFLAYKTKETSPANANKINWAWEKYYKDDKLVNRRLGELTVPELKEWFLDKIADYHLTTRKYRDMKALMNMLYDYAISLGLVTYNVSRNIKNISYKKFTPERKKSVTEQIYIDDEETRLVELAYKKFEETHNTAYLAIILNCSLGLRVGELVALKRSDFNFNTNTVHIQRQERKLYDPETLKRSGFEVVPYTKSLNSDRVLILTSVAQQAYKMIVKHNMENQFFSEYLLLNNDGVLINNDTINRLLRQLNKELGTVQKSNHNLRKTCLSNMNASNLLSDEEIRMFAGHKDIATTQNSYIFATGSLNTRSEAYEKAIDSKINNVFKRVQ